MPRSLPSCLGLLLAGREAGVIDRLQRGVERRTEIADVIGHDHGGLVREGRDEVLAAQFRRIDLQLSRRGFHHTLDQKTRFGAARTPVGIDRRGVGINADHLGIDRWNIVLA